jgi:hypothetical protein
VLANAETSSAPASNDPDVAPPTGSITHDKSCSRSRREFIWMGMENDDQAPLPSIEQQFANAIEAHVLTKRTALRRLRSLDNQSPSQHECTGYLKEEIILGANFEDSAILTSSFPNIHEICYICNKRVEKAVEEALSTSLKSCKVIIQPALTPY